MTREEIRTKHGIVRLVHPDLANKQLSIEEAGEYEKTITMLADNFAKYWDDDDSGDID